MKKTGSTFEKEIFHLIRDSTLKSKIGGNVYRSGMRPFNSSEEDAVVTFITGIDGERQKGMVTINVYVPNINYEGKTKVRNIGRCNEIESYLQEIVQELKKDGYRFSLASIIQTFSEEEIDQHFVSVKLKFEYVSF